MNKNIRQKFIISAALMIAATASAFAQGNGLAGINEATSMVSSYFDPGTSHRNHRKIKEFIFLIINYLNISYFLYFCHILPIFRYSVHF